MPGRGCIAMQQRVRLLRYAPWFLLAVAVARPVWFRVSTLAVPFIEEPHAWRQADTQAYIDNYVRYGIDLLSPRLDKLGGHVPLILEFPLHEALAAILSRAFE